MGEIKMVNEILENILSKFPIREGHYTKEKVKGFFLQLAPEHEEIFMSYINEVIEDGGCLQEHVNDGNLFYLDDLVSGYEVLVRSIGEQLGKDGEIYYSGNNQHKVVIRTFLDDDGGYKLDYKKSAYKSGTTKQDNKGASSFIPIKTLEMYLNTFYATKRVNSS